MLKVSENGLRRHYDWTAKARAANGPVGRAPRPFLLVERNGESATFESAQPLVPQRVSYRRIDETLTITLHEHLETGARAWETAYLRCAGDEMTR